MQIGRSRNERKLPNREEAILRNSSDFMATLLIIDDDDDLREFLATLLLDEGYVVLDARCPDDAFAILKREEADLIISDLDMPFTTGASAGEYEFSFRVGVQTIRELVWVFPWKPIIGMSALPPLVLRKLEKELGTVPLLPKPFRQEELLRLIQSQLHARQTEVMQ